MGIGVGVVTSPPSEGVLQSLLVGGNTATAGRSGSGGSRLPKHPNSIPSGTASGECAAPASPESGESGEDDVRLDAPQRPARKSSDAAEFLTMS